MSFGQAFITTWKTNNPGISGNNQVTIPTTGIGYSYSIYWEQVGNNSINGTIPGPITGNYTITFPTTGTYKVSITGVFPRIYFPEDGVSGNTRVYKSDHDKLLTVEQWGNNEWTSMARAFAHCSNLTIPAADSPNLTQVTDMSDMFFQAYNFNEPLEAWDVSNVKYMAGMFHSAQSFNLPLEKWNVSNVIYMQSMFENAKSFNQPLESWNVSSVTNMSAMFLGATNFNQPIGNWDVSNVTDISSMFRATGFNQPLESWNVGKVKAMYGVFGNAFNFNQPLNGWNVSNVLSMQEMFLGATNFNQSLESWNVGNVINMDHMFYNATSFNQPLGMWNISNVGYFSLISMKDMLSNSGLNISNYDQTLIGWAAQNVKPTVSLGANGLIYCAGEEARAKLISKGWTITGDRKGSITTTPELSITQPVCKGETGSITVKIINADDMYSFDNGVTFQTSNVQSGLVAATYSVVAKNSKGCESAPVQAIINPPFDVPAPVILGSDVVCPNVTAVEYSANIDQYQYTWFISGGTVQSQQNNKIVVNWGPTNFNSWIKVTATDQNNCPIDTVTFPVKIQIKLKPAILNGTDSVCYNFREGVPYQTTNTTGSVYKWFTDGAIISEGQTTSQAKINFADLGKYKLWVKEENTTSTDYCEGFSDTLNVTVFKDLAAITMNFVSVDYKDDKKVQIQWDVTLLERISDLVIVSRRIAGSNSPWETVATLQKNVQTFLDQNVHTNQNIYEYKVEGFNKCDEGLQTVIHNTIKLDGDKDEAQELIDLFWNDYNGWDGVERYEVWRKLDNDTTYRLIDLTPGNITNYSGKHGGDGFVHMLRIKAKKKGENTISWSNDLELKFDNPIDFIPNVITPNDDDKNEYFFIPKLYLYPENYLGIYDRWGALVYQKRNYTNDWNADGLPEGVYYYILNLDRNNFILKGWIQVIR